jgi:hypothetical protein
VASAPTPDRQMVPWKLGQTPRGLLLLGEQEATGVAQGLVSGLHWIWGLMPTTSHD